MWSYYWDCGWSGESISTAAGTSIESNILELESGTDSMNNNDLESTSDSNSNNNGESIQLESDSQSSEVENSNNSSSLYSSPSDSLFFQDFSNYYDSIVISVIVIVGVISAYL